MHLSPIGYDIFSGNTFDGKTLKPFLQRLKERFSIDKVVADRGINSKLNLWSIKELGYGYTVATRLRGMGREVLEEVFKEEGYKELADTSDVFRYKTIPYII
ncbi:MAG TPA: transposase, partial [Nitrospirae bacterium]|nr:transposase [Nitrospirota bacterium]